MTKTLFITAYLLCTFKSYSQTENDYNDLLNLAIENFSYDSTIVFKKFDNSSLLEDFDFVIGEKLINISNRYKSKSVNKYLELTSANMYNDTATVSFKGLKFYMERTFKKLKKTQFNKIKRYAKKSFKRNKSLPIVKISFPIISANLNQSIVYYSNIRGSLNANGGYLLFKKVNGKWKLHDEIITWIS